MEILRNVIYRVVQKSDTPF